MTWPDFVVIVLCVLLGIVESKRGFVVAFFDMIGAIIVLELTATSYLGLVSPSLSYCAAYLVAFLVGIAILGVLTSLLKRYTQFDIGSFDSPLGGLLGVFTALVLSHAMYGAVILGYGGKNAPVYTGSLFASQIYDLNAVHGFLDFMGKIGSSDIGSRTSKS